MMASQPSNARILPTTNVGSWAAASPAALAKEGKDVRMVDGENRVELRHHPRQREVGEGRVVVASANVAVDAWEPGLFQDFELVRLNARPVPDGRRVCAPVFVQGERLERVLDVRLDAGVYECKVPARWLWKEADHRDAQSAYRVPDGDAFDLDARPGEVVLYQLLLIVWVGDGGLVSGKWQVGPLGHKVLFLLELPILKHLDKVLEALRRQQTNSIDQARDRPCSESASREANDEDLVALVVI